MSAVRLMSCIEVSSEKCGNGNKICFLMDIERLHCRRCTNKNSEFNLQHESVVAGHGTTKHSCCQTRSSDSAMTDRSRQPPNSGEPTDSTADSPHLTN